MAGMFPGVRSSRSANPLYEELNRQRLEELKLGEYSPDTRLKQPEDPGIDPYGIAKSFTVDPAMAVGEGIAGLIEPRAPEQPRDMPLPGTGAYFDVMERKLRGEDLSKAANDRRAFLAAGKAAEGEYRLPRPPTEPLAAPQGPTGTAGGDIGAGLGPGTADPRQAQPLGPQAPPGGGGFDFRYSGTGPAVRAAGMPPPGPMPGPQTPPPAPGGDMREQMAKREGDLGNLAMAREISEGLKLAGRSLVGLSGAQIPQGDDRSEGIRGAIAKREDEVSPQMRQILESKGLVIPEGMSQSKLVQMGVVPQHFTGQRAAAGRESQEAITLANIKGRRQAAGAAGRERVATEERAETRAEAKELRSFVAKEREAWRSKTNKFGLYNSAIEATSKVDGLLAEGTNQAFNTALTIVLKGMAGEAGNIAQKEREALANEMGIQGVWNYIGGALWTGKPTAAQFEAIGRIAKLVGQEQRNNLKKYTKGQLDTAMEADIVKQSGMSREDMLSKLQSGGESAIDASTDETVTYRMPGGVMRKIPKSLIAEFETASENAGAVRQPRR